MTAEYYVGGVKVERQDFDDPGFRPFDSRYTVPAEGADRDSVVPAYAKDWQEIRIDRTQREKCADGDHEQNGNARWTLSGITFFSCVHCRCAYVPKPK